MKPKAAAPAYRSAPAYVTTNGDVAAHIGEMVELTADANQRDALDVIFAEATPGHLACFEVGIIAPRQNIKTATLEIAQLTDLFVFRKPLNIWTAHLYKATKRTFRDMVNRIDSCADLSAKCKRPTTANGNEAIELTTGERIEFHARSKGGGRSFSGDTVTLDEALLLGEDAMGALLPVMATRINGQVRYGSSAGLVTSSVLRGLRNRGRAGSDGALGYFEWCAPPRDCALPDCSHRFGEVNGCALDDERLWALANPTLGDRIQLDTIAKMRRAMPPEEFMREFLGWWDEARGALLITEPAWNDCADPESLVNDPICVGVEVAIDRSSACIGVAGVRSDHLPGVELAAQRPGTSWVLEQVAKMRGEQSVAAVALDPSSPAGSLIPSFEAAGIEILTPAVRQVTQACGAFYDAVVTAALRHRTTTALTDAALAASKHPVADSWRWDRYGPDVAPLYAVTLALWAQQDAPLVSAADSIF
jgi:hypothetical protein